MDNVSKAATPAQIREAEAREARKAAAAERAAKPAPTFVHPETRVMTVPLEFPVEYDGKVYDEVTIRRPTIREWNQYLRACADAVAENGPGADDQVDQPWMSIPAVVMEALDFVDATRVEASQNGFFEQSSLPQEAGEESPSPSTPETGAPSPSE